MGHPVNGTTRFIGPALPGQDLQFHEKKSDIGRVRLLGPFEPSPKVVPISSANSSSYILFVIFIVPLIMTINITDGFSNEVYFEE